MTEGPCFGKKRTKMRGREAMKKIAERLGHDGEPMFFPRKEVEELSLAGVAAVFSI